MTLSFDLGLGCGTYDGGMGLDMVGGGGDGIAAILGSFGGCGLVFSIVSFIGSVGFSIDFLASNFAPHSTQNFVPLGSLVPQFVQNS